MKTLLAILVVMISTAFTVQQKKQRIVFFGDSITQAGVQPTGYITRMNEMLKQKGKDANYELIGAGIGGNKVYDLYLRLEDDVLSKNPDLVVIWIGVNDVWHKQSSGTGTDADKFEKFYEAIIKKLKAKNIEVVLCTPSAIGERTDYTNQLDGDLNRYSEIIRKIAANHKLKLVDLRKSFLEFNLANNKDNKESGILTSDRVHLNEKGNQFVAEQMLNILSP